MEFVDYLTMIQFSVFIYSLNKNSPNKNKQLVVTSQKKTETYLPIYLFSSVSICSTMLQIKSIIFYRIRISGKHAITDLLKMLSNLFSSKRFETVEKCRQLHPKKNDAVEMLLQ